MNVKHAYWRYLDQKIYFVRTLKRKCLYSPKLTTLSCKNSPLKLAMAYSRAISR